MNRARVSSYRFFTLDGVNRPQTSKFVRYIAWLTQLDLKQLHFSTCRSSALQCRLVVGEAIVPSGLFMIAPVPNRDQFRMYGISNLASRQLPLFRLDNSRVRDPIALPRIGGRITRELAPFKRGLLIHGIVCSKVPPWTDILGHDLFRGLSTH
jgi:hypothetical protein